MANGPIAKPAKYKTSKEDPGIPGVFALLENELMFTPNDPACPMELHLGFRYIEKIYNTGETTKQPPMLKIIRKDGLCFFEFESFRDLWGLVNALDNSPGASQIAFYAREDTPWRTRVIFSDVRRMIADLDLHTNPLLEDRDSVVPIAEKMSKIQIVKRANRKVSSCDPADPGVLGLLDSKIVFSPDNPTSPRKLVVEIRDIKCLINNEKGPAWLGFTSYKDGKICLEFPSFSDLLDFRKLVDNALAAGFGEAAEATSAAQSTSESSVFSHGAIATAAELQRSVDDLRQRGEPYRKLEEAMRYAVVER